MSGMGTGLVINDQVVPVPGVDVVNFRDDPRLRLAAYDKRLRTARELAWVHLVVCHTTGGIPGGADLRPQVVKPGLGQPTGGGDRVVASWTGDPSRPGGAHLVVDQDGSSYCCADLLREAAYHAERANGVSVGIEVVQGHAEPDLYQGQLEAAARLALWVCRLMPVPIQWQVPAAYAGGPVERFVTSLETDRPLADVVGIVGHRDLTSRRGSGDPGDAVMDALVAAGCERLDFASGADLAAWKVRQSQTGEWYADGVPGPQTADALKKAGYADGIWRLPPGQPG
jgi:hypothetical protein